MYNEITPAISNAPYSIPFLQNYPWPISKFILITSYCSSSLSMSATPRIDAITPTTFNAPNTEIKISGGRFGSLDTSTLTLIIGETKITGGGTITTVDGVDTWTVNVPCLPAGTFTPKVVHDNMGEFYMPTDIKVTASKVKYCVFLTSVWVEVEFLKRKKNVCSFESLPRNKIKQLNDKKVFYLEYVWPRIHCVELGRAITLVNYRKKGD